MSAVIVDYPSQHRVVRPDLTKVRAALVACERDPQLLFLAARAGINLAAPHYSSRVTPAIEQLTATRLTVAFLALGELLGIGHEKMLSSLI